MELQLPDELASHIRALLDFVNGHNVTGDQFLLIVQHGYIQLTQKALSQLQELRGAVHEWNKNGNSPNN